MTKGETMPDQKSTPRPWAWEWSALNTITIYQPTTGLHPNEVAEITVPDHLNDGMRREAEGDAALIVEAVNAWGEKRDND